MRRISQNFGPLTGFFVLIFVQALSVAAQSSSSASRADPEEGYMIPLILFVIALSAFGAAYFFWKRSKRTIETTQYNYGKYAKNHNKNESFDLGGVDAAKEMEWLRKSRKSSPLQAKSKSKTSLTVKMPVGSPTIKAPRPEPDLSTQVFQEKMRKMQYAQLPINSFTELRPAGLYEPLPLSDDPAVLDAIEQVNDEYESDEVIRDLALRILTAFRTRNSVEALAQIALYDLSSSLRSRAVATLTDFDHESVFEAILLACADPTREVRAAAARGLFKLNFDRANAWKRIMETNDEFRMSHAARAALESGIVVKSFDRLVHEDRKVAYEAFCLVCMMVKSGETDPVFTAIRTHKDERVRYALLHVLKVIKDERTLDELNRISLETDTPTDVADRIRATIESFEMVAS